MKLNRSFKIPLERKEKQDDDLSNKFFRFELNSIEQNSIPSLPLYDGYRSTEWHFERDSNLFEGDVPSAWNKLRRFTSSSVARAV